MWLLPTLPEFFNIGNFPPRVTRKGWEHKRVELNWDGSEIGSITSRCSERKYNLDRAIITRSSQDNLVTSTGIANTLVQKHITLNLGDMLLIGNNHEFHCKIT